ncbi:MAG: hypothetical protein JO304_10015 [Solirubrobacterales bacterium]|nr:hypothetical protein [Solirubrobacterales bacterium]
MKLWVKQKASVPSGGRGRREDRTGELLELSLMARQAEPRIDGGCGAVQDRGALPNTGWMLRRRFFVELAAEICSQHAAHE